MLGVLVILNVIFFMLCLKTSLESGFPVTPIDFCVNSLIYIVPTPIGNLSDITQRALEVLQAVDLIAAEDTRHTGLLLQHFAINARLFALHDHNEQQKAETLLAKLKEGQNIALVSDAGTPLINDPGYHLVRTCREANIRVVPLPGPCAAIAALSAAGLPSDRFCYEGFLPAKSKTIFGGVH